MAKISGCCCCMACRPLGLVVLTDAAVLPDGAIVCKSEAEPCCMSGGTGFVLLCLSELLLADEFTAMVICPISKTHSWLTWSLNHK